jgi:hypothetical protein
MLNIDELAAAIRSTSPEEPAQRLAGLLIEWQRDDTTANELRAHIERVIGYTWFSTDAVHGEIYRLWSAFCTDAIDGIGGMTMNERLHWFGLVQRFDGATTEEAKRRIYAKLHARP